MGGWVDGRMDGRTDGWTSRQTYNRRTDSPTDGRTNGRLPADSFRLALRILEAESGRSSLVRIYGEK